MALSPGFVSFIGTLSSSAKAVYKSVLQSLTVQIKVIMQTIDVRAVPINIAILTYTQYVNVLRATYNTTKQTFTPVMAIFSGKSGGSGNALTTNTQNRIPEFGIVNSAVDTYTMPIYKKLSDAETKLRSLKLEKEKITANQLKLQNQYDSIQEQINML